MTNFVFSSRSFFLEHSVQFTQPFNNGYFKAALDLRASLPHLDDLDPY